MPWSELGVDIPIRVFSLAEKSLAPKAESESVAVAAIVFERHLSKSNLTTKMRGFLHKLKDFSPKLMISEILQCLKLQNR